MLQHMILAGISAGTNDWMDSAAALRICDTLRAQEAPAAQGVKHANEVLYVQNAGHFPFLEKPSAFDAVLLDVLAWCLGPEQGAADAAAKQSGDAEEQPRSAEDIRAAFIEV